MSQYLIIYPVLALLLYAVIPTALARLCGLGAISRLPAGKRVCLTFDDGPDPRYTPQLLEILGKAGMKGCFFVVGEKAGKYPDLLKRIIAEGHEIGSHGFSHRNHWVLGPFETVREIKKSFKAIEEVAGFSPDTFRPPWGLFNLSHLVARLLLGYKAVLWSFMSWDWARGSTPEVIAAKVKRKMSDGSILVFHDSDTQPWAAAESPRNMLDALPDILEEIKKRGYRTASLKEFTHSGKSYFYRLLLFPWRAWDYLFRMALGVKDVTGEDHGPTIFRVAVRRYPGPRAELPWGGLLKRGEKVCEIHLNNEFIRKLLGEEIRPAATGVKIAGELKRSLPALARRISIDPRFSETEFIMGVSLLHRGAAAIGFKTLDIPAPAARWISMYQRLLLKLYHPLGSGRLSGKGRLEPKIIVMSKKNLLDKYLKAGPY